MAPGFLSIVWEKTGFDKNFLIFSVDKSQSNIDFLVSTERPKKCSSRELNLYGMHRPKLKELHFPAFSKIEIDFAGAGITASGGQDDFFTMNPHLLNGIDVSQVQDIGE